MKNLLKLWIILSVVLSTSANSYREILSKIYDIEELVTSYERRIGGRDNIAQDIYQILSEAQEKVQRRLERRGGGNRDVIDIKLVQISQSSCGVLGTYDSRFNCYKENLIGTSGVLGQIYDGCSSLSSTQQGSTCFNLALSEILNGNTVISEVSKNSCGSLGTYEARKVCFDNMLKNVYDNALRMFFTTCSQDRSFQQASQCYVNGLNNYTRGEQSFAKLIIASCGDLGTYESRANCFDRSVEFTDTIGENLSRYTRGCYSQSSYQQKSSCYTSVLSTL